MNCPICENGLLAEVADITTELDGYIFVLKGKRCSSCSEEFIDEQEGQPMIHSARKFGIWGNPLKLHRKLSKSARGTVLRIPADIEKDFDLKGTEEVAISKIGERKLLVEIE